ncbi:hypothetical protein TL16_g04839 [Triparma laevis f. inornata]|uniref:Leucine-rich repeat domain-containing protein n=1 Tax=Triparma laevis f. inornata TaxID=1714386 RepID=A0A9W7E6Q7_9STRA|nr:hypothetical protein TL16_g04839 [Triparma laevis f. inornata]
MTTETAAQATVIEAQATDIAELTTEVTTLTTENAALKIANAPPAHTDDFISTIDFKRHFVEFLHVEILLTLRKVNKEWSDVVKERIDRSVESGEMIVHGGEDVDDEVAEAREERLGLVTQVIFLRNIVQIGGNACCYAYNLVVADISEGVKNIGGSAFFDCHSLTTVSFPTTLTSIGDFAFGFCHSQENVDLLHTNLQELGEGDFQYC